MKKTIYSFVVICALITACDALPAARSSGQSAPAASAGIVLTNPYDGEHLQLGQACDVRSEISSPASVASVTLIINSDPYRQDSFNKSYQDANVYQPWTPRAPGEYILHTVFTDNTGSRFESNPVTVYVDGPAEETVPQTIEESPTDSQELPEADECSQPIATVNSYINCRSGPGTGYGIAAEFKPGQEYPVLGKSYSGTWWQVQYRESGALCWVWTNLVSICGSTDDVRKVAVDEKDEIPETAPEESPNQPSDSSPNQPSNSSQDQPPDSPPDQPPDSPPPQDVTPDPGTGPTTPGDPGSGPTTPGDPGSGPTMP